MTQPATYAVIPSAGQPIGEPPSLEQKAAARGGNGGAAFAATGMSLLDELAGSLQASQRALLAQDVTGLEQYTGEQIRLHRALEICWSQGGLPHDDLSQHGLSQHEQSQRGLPSGDARSFDHSSAAELRSAQMRVRHLGLVQAALLARAQRRLRMLARLLAGSGAGYAPPAGDWTAVRPAWRLAGRGDVSRSPEKSSQEVPGQEKRSQHSGPEKDQEKREANQKNSEERGPCRV